MAPRPQRTQGGQGCAACHALTLTRALTLTLTPNQVRGLPRQAPTRMRGKSSRAHSRRGRRLALTLTLTLTLTPTLALTLTLTLTLTPSPTPNPNPNPTLTLTLILTLIGAREDGGGDGSLSVT